MKAPSQHTDLRRRKAVADAIAGLGASLVALWTFYPLDVIKTNHQAGIELSGGFDLYRGVGAKTLHSAASSFIYFYLYSWITTWWTERTNTSKISTLARLSLSAVAAMLNTAVTLPLDVVSSQQQTSFSKGDSGRKPGQVLQQELETVEEDDEEEDEQDNFFDPEEDFIDVEKKDDEDLKDLIVLSPPVSSTDNIASLWKGLAPSLLLCSNPSIHYTVFDLLKANLLDGRPKQNLSLLEAFAMGLIAKLTATLATYPLIRAKILLMVTHRKSLLGCLIREYKRDGVRGLYRGCNLQLAHTILKSALLMMVRERITATTHNLILPK